jgi:hypothetical protein
MKRTEMLEKLKAELESRFTYNYSDEEISDILAVLEGAGMVPPGKETWTGHVSHTWDPENN